MTIEMTEEIQMGTANKVAKSTITLTMISNDPEVNKGALLLDEMQEFFNHFETTTMFFINQLFMTYKNVYPNNPFI